MKTLISLIAIVGSVAVAHAGITNGSFQDGAGNSATGWTLGGSNALALTDNDYITNAGGYGASPYGGRFLSFNAGDVAANNWAYQDFATAAGTTYTVSFAFANFGVSTNQQLNVLLSDSNAGVLLSSSYANSNGSNDLSAIWNSTSVTFTAVGATTRLTFSDAGSTTNSTDLLVDNVAVEAVPEPMTMIALAGGVAAMLRRRRS
jgi:hypothetical protein